MFPSRVTHHWARGAPPPPAATVTPAPPAPAPTVVPAAEYVTRSTAPRYSILGNKSKGSKVPRGGADKILEYMKNIYCFATQYISDPPRI